MTLKGPPIVADLFVADKLTVSLTTIHFLARLMLPIARRAHVLLARPSRCVESNMINAMLKAQKSPSK
jgi:hypothetical protein